MFTPWRKKIDISKAYYEYRPRLQRFLARMGAGIESDDLVQETFLAALKYLEKEDLEVGNEYRWLEKIAQNLLFNSKRKTLKVAKVEAFDFEGTLLAPENSENNALAYLESQENARFLMSALGDLPKVTKKVAILRIISDMSFEEIADCMKISESTARVHIHKAKMKLRDSYK